MEVFLFPVRHPEFGLPFGITWFHLFPAVRTRATQLDAMVEDLDPSTLFPSRPPYAPWVRFVRISIELSILLSQLKTQAMRLATIRMLNRGNPLGAVLCARSLLEHYALGLYLGERVLADWKTIQDTARSNRPLKPALDALERDVARYLSGTKGTEELSRSWRERWERLKPGQYMGIPTPIERAFPGGDLRGFLYGYFSQIVHGAQLTGGDLLEPGAEELVYVVLAKAVAVLASLEQIDSELDVVATAHLAMEKLAAIERVVEAQEGADLPRTVRASVLPGRLKPGRDVWGSGTAEGPYRFRASLDYYEAFNRFCEQEEIRIAQRVAWISGGFLGDRVIMIDGREIFFHKGARLDE